MIIFKILMFTLLITATPLHHVFAQNSDVTGDESFDPFSDYNEFEQEVEEEADINFLRNGRFLTLAFQTGYRGYTGGFAEGYTGALTYGVQINYFFDLNIAGTLGYKSGDSNVSFRTDNGSSSQAFTGNVNIQVIDILMKYYFNTDNVTKGLADLNPYMVVGAGYFTRTYNLSSNFGNDPDRVTGFELGGGLEIPLLRRRAYLGLQAVYNYVQFPDENKHFIEVSSGNSQPITPHLDGDIYDLNLILGINF